jgi:outer membrane protein OmpA-like peptidoglycan-associated protein
MRRISSLFLSLGLIAAGVAFVATSASAAPGDLTTATSPTIAPIAITGATPAKLVRLPIANAFLAFGRVVSTSGAHNYLWKINADLTIDATFGAVDLGDEFAYPTAAQSACVASSDYFCDGFDALIVNERLGKYAISYTRQMKGTSGSDASITSIAVGSLSSGAVTAKSMFLSLISGTAANFAAYTTNELAKDQCATGTGASINGAPLSWYRLDTHGLQFRPDGSILISITCNYSNFDLLSTLSPGTLKQSSTFFYAVLKPSGATLIIDTSFGISGQAVISDGISSCTKFSMPVSSIDSSITSLSSTQPYFFHMSAQFPMTTAIPSIYSTLSHITGFDGCDSFSIGTTYTNKLLPFTTAGIALPTRTISTGTSQLSIQRWVIDTEGRWNTLLQIMSGNTSTYSALRLVNGVLDTTLGANGQKEVANLPSTLTSGTSTVNMFYSISGLVNTATGSYFTGFATTGFGGNCNITSNVTRNVYPYHLSFDTGLLTSFGANGLGAEGSTSSPENAVCVGTVANASYIDSSGRASYLASQATGLTQFKWDAATGVTSGGDGDTGVEVAPAPTTTIPAATTTTTTIAKTTTTTIAKTTTTTIPKNRIDSKIYRKNLPVITQRDTALQVLSAKDATKFNIQTTTPKICTPLSSAVLLVNPGRCVIQVVDANTKKIIRSSSTLVKNTASLRGSVLSTSNPIDFDFAQIDLTKSAKVQVQAIAKLAKGARRIAVISHTASLTNFYAWNLAISRGRALAVKAALQNAGVKASIEIVALTNVQPFVSKSANSSQAQNRRVEVYIFPS